MGNKRRNFKMRPYGLPRKEEDSLFKGAPLRKGQRKSKCRVYKKIARAASKRQILEFFKEI